MTMKIRLTSVPVTDQQHAQEFYCGVLGFEKKHDIDLGEFRWLTVVSPEEPDAAELLLEPNAHPASKAFQEALHNDGIPIASFEVANIDAEYQRLLAAGVAFNGEPADAGGTMVAVFDDTCGNLVQLHQPAQN